MNVSQRMWKQQEQPHATTGPSTPLKSNLSFGEAKVPVHMWEAVHLLIRQLVFVFVFAVMFVVTFLNRVYIITEEESTYIGWLLHTIATSGFGCATFLVFGMTKTNYILWTNMVRRFISFFVRRRKALYEEADDDEEAEEHEQTYFET